MELNWLLVIYSGIPISQTSKGNENWFSKSEVQDIGGIISMNKSNGDDFWFELCREGSRNRDSSVLDIENDLK